VAGNQAQDLQAEPRAGADRADQPDPTPTAGRAKAVGAAEPESGGRPPRRKLVIGLAVALGIALILLFGQLQKSRSLEARVDVLESELAAAHQRLGAYDRYLDAVRELVGGVSARMRALESLVASGPEGVNEAEDTGEVQVDGPVATDSETALGDQSAAPAGD
jgi:hypothetical protein